MCVKMLYSITTFKNVFQYQISKVNKAKFSTNLIHVSILPQIPFPSRLTYNTEQSFLCYTVHLCWIWDEALIPIKEKKKGGWHRNCLNCSAISSILARTLGVFRQKVLSGGVPYFPGMILPWYHCHAVIGWFWSKCSSISSGRASGAVNQLCSLQRVGCGVLITVHGQEKVLPG